MKFLKRIFRGAVEQAQEFDAAVDSCRFMSSNESCSLVQQLKDKQAEKREIDDKIRAFERCEPVILKKFIELLLKLEEAGFEMGVGCWPHYRPSAYNSRIKDAFNSYFGVNRLEMIIAQTSEMDIDTIYTELKAMKNRVNVLNGLHQQSTVLADEIKKVKAQLGIE